MFSLKSPSGGFDQKLDDSEKGFFWIPALLAIGVATVLIGGTVYTLNRPKGKFKLGQPTLALTESGPKIVSLPYTFRWNSLKTANERGVRYPKITCYGGLSPVKTESLPSDTVETSGVLTFEFAADQKGNHKIRCVDWTGSTGVDATMTVNLDLKAGERELPDQEKFDPNLAQTSWELEFYPEGNVASGLFKFYGGKPQEPVYACERNIFTLDCSTLKGARSLYGEYDGKNLEVEVRGDVIENYGGKITFTASLDEGAEIPTFSGRWRLKMEDAPDREGTLKMTRFKEIENK